MGYKTFCTPNKNISVKYNALTGAVQLVCVDKKKLLNNITETEFIGNNDNLYEDDFFGDDPVDPCGSGPVDPCPTPPDFVTPGNFDSKTQLFNLELKSQLDNIDDFVLQVYFRKDQSSPYSPQLIVNNPASIWNSKTATRGTVDGSKLVNLVKDSSLNTGNIWVFAIQTKSSCKLVSGKQAFVTIGSSGDDIVSLAVDTPQLSNLVDNLKETELVDSIKKMQNLTIFAPTNSAFEDISSLLETLNIEQITNILLNHVVDGIVYSSDITNNLSVMTYGGGKLTFKVEDNRVTICTYDSNNKLLTESNVINADIEASNGVVHIIDSVLMSDTINSKNSY